jgi:plasmid stabilization system protein ParE
VKRTIRIEPEADDEVRAAAEWYEARKHGLGHAFVAAVDGAIDRIVGTPDAVAPVPGVSLPVRRVFTKRFPYSIVFMLVDGEIIVIAIAHMKREPGYWISRLNR